MDTADEDPIPPPDPPALDEEELVEFEDLTDVPYDPDDEAARPAHVLYEPREVLIASLPGPLGGCFLLTLNWARLGSPIEASLAFVFGVLATVWLAWGAVATFRGDGAVVTGMAWIGCLIGMYGLSKLLLADEIARHRKLDGRIGTPWMAGVVGAVCLGLVASEVVTLAITANHYTTQGWLHLNKGEHEEAIEDYTTALLLMPYDAELHHNRGLAKDSTGDLEGALADYEATARLDPKHEFANYNRARVLGGLSRATEALAAIDLHIEQNPSDPRAHRIRGALRQSLGHHPAAVEDYAKAAELDPKEHEYPELQGYAQHLAGNHRAALPPLDRAVEMSPDCSTAYHYRGLAKAALADHRGAADDFTKAIELYADEPGESLAAYHYERARVYLALGELKRAKEDCDEALRREPGHPAPRRLREQIRRELQGK